MLHTGSVPMVSLITRLRPLLTLPVLVAVLPGSVGAQTYITQWGSLGTGNGQFGYPRGVATDRTGHVYVADTNNGRIQKFDISGAYLMQWGSAEIGSEQYFRPYGVATDA